MTLKKYKKKLVLLIGAVVLFAFKNTSLAQVNVNSVLAYGPGVTLSPEPQTFWERVWAFISNPVFYFTALSITLIALVISLIFAIKGIRKVKHTSSQGPDVTKPPQGK